MTIMQLTTVYDLIRDNWREAGVEVNPIYLDSSNSNGSSSGRIWVRLPRHTCSPTLQQASNINPMLHGPRILLVVESRKSKVE
jgi:hypothetical protein